ncbi:Flp family type IVb pilin, partial [Vibrio owensii]
MTNSLTTKVINMNLLKQFLNNEDGITAIEYAIIGVAMSSAL